MKSKIIRSDRVYISDQTLTVQASRMRNSSEEILSIDVFLKGEVVGRMDVSINADTQTYQSSFISAIGEI